MRNLRGFFFLRLFLINVDVVSYYDEGAYLHVDLVCLFVRVERGVAGRGGARMEGHAKLVESMKDVRIARQMSEMRVAFCCFFHLISYPWRRGEG